MPSMITTFFFSIIVASGLVITIHHNFWKGLSILAVGSGLTYLFLKCDVLIHEADEIIKRSKERTSNSGSD